MKRTVLASLVGMVALTLAALGSFGDGGAQAGKTADHLSKETLGPGQPKVPGIPEDFRRAASGAGTRLILQAQGLMASVPEAQSPTGRAPFAPVPGQPGVDVTVNDPSLDTPDSTTQSETTLAVRGSTVCAGYNDSGVGGFSGFSRSADLGATWTDKGGIGQSGDPVLAVHEATGTFYYAELALIGAVSAVGVARSTDDCNSFSAPANASPAGSGAAHLQDKPWIAVDNTGGPRDGYVYVCWTRFVDYFPGPATSGEIRFSRSIDGGVTFGNDQVISPVTDDFPFGCHIDVGPNGEVYVAWSDRGVDFPIRFRRSLDGGLTWETPVQVNTAPIRHPGMDRIVECESGAYRTTLNGDIRMLAQAWMAVDTTGGPFDGNIYVVWAHDPSGNGDNSDVFFSYSADGGLTWAPEVQVAGGTQTDQFEPFVEVAGSGTVSLAWYDRRNDPGNNFDIDVYKTFSRDGGVTLDPIVRVTDGSFPVPPLTGQPTASGQFDPGVLACYMGEYIAIAGDASNFYYAWGDNRNTVVSANYPAGRPDPDVFFDRQAVPPVVPPCSGFDPGTDSDLDSFDDFAECYMDTDVLDDCADDDVGDNEDPDPWPPDGDDDQDADVGDVIRLFLGKLTSPPNPYSLRSDADADGDVDVGDVIKLFMGKILTKCTVFTFTNGTGGNVDDIHIEWNAPITAVFSAVDSDLESWSNRTISGGGLILDMDRPDSQGDLAASGQLTIVVWAPTAPGSTVASCRWTLDSVDKGPC